MKKKTTTFRRLEAGSKAIDFYRRAQVGRGDMLYRRKNKRLGARIIRVFFKIDDSKIPMKYARIYWDYLHELSSLM